MPRWSVTKLGTNLGTFSSANQGVIAHSKHPSNFLDDNVLGPKKPNLQRRLLRHCHALLSVFQVRGLQNCCACVVPHNFIVHDGNGDVVGNQTIRLCWFRLTRATLLVDLDPCSQITRTSCFCVSLTHYFAFQI